jgi:hypothetical protein
MIVANGRIHNQDLSYALLYLFTPLYWRPLFAGEYVIYPNNYVLLIHGTVP